jgi:ABC-2 type transport system permease protein
MSKTLKEKQKSEKKSIFFRVFSMLAILVLTYLISSLLHWRLDMTGEKRYSITDATKSILRKQEDPILVKVYLEGDLQTGFLRLKNSTKDLLTEMREASGGKLTFEFINPIEKAKNEQEKVSIYKDLVKKGLQPTNLKIKSDEGYSEQIIFPGLLVSIGDQTLPIQILENQVGHSPEEALNHSAISLEYKIANAIKKLTQKEDVVVTFMEGQGEYSEIQLLDFVKKLEESKYKVRFTNVRSKVKGSTGDSVGVWFDPKTELLIIARPTQPFTEVEKYRIDQFVMNGGKVLWIFDGVDAEMNYLRNDQMMFMAQGFNLNLDDQLFQYGVRINKNLLQDAELSGPIPIMDNNTHQPSLYPWLFYPYLVPNNAHPIGRNLDPIQSLFASSIDTINNDIRKQVLISTSKYSRALPEPARVHLGAIKEKPNAKYFKQSYLPVGVLLEGRFQSVFKNRLAPEFVNKANQMGLKPIARGKETKMIILSDGDIVRNEVSSKGETYPLGYNMYTNQTFANMDFMINCVDYLTDMSGLITARNKEIKLRLLDKQKIKEEQIKWQMINLLVPTGMVILFALIYTYIRRRKWTIDYLTK